MTTCIAYIRVSTERQAEEGNGLEQQSRAIRAYAAASGLHVDEWVVDDETGTSEERDGIQALLAREGAFTLVFDRINRLGRTLLVSESLFAKFMGRGVQLRCVAQQLDDSPVGRLTRQIMGAFAEYERTEMLLRLAAAKRAAQARRGTYGGGGMAYGFRTLGNGKLAVDVGGANLVRRCYELAEQPEATLRSIAAELTQEGYTTRKGTVIQANQIKRILDRKKVYLAEKNVGTVPLDQGVRPQHPRILS